jgi:hypothetical protein
MTAVDDVDQLIEQFHLASNEFLKGNPRAYEGPLLPSGRRQPR